MTVNTSVHGQDGHVWLKANTMGTSGAPLSIEAHDSSGKIAEFTVFTGDQDYTDCVVALISIAKGNNHALLSYLRSLPA